MKKVITVLAIIIFVPVVLCAGIYLYIAWQYHDTYMNGVMINGIYAADYGRICLHCLIDAALGGKHKRLNIGI